MRGENTNISNSGLGSGNSRSCWLSILKDRYSLSWPDAVGLIGVGAHGGRQRVPQGPQDSILVGTRDFLERGTDALVEPRERARARRRRRDLRIEARHEQIGERPGDRRIVHQHLRDVALAERQSGLQQIAAIGAQHRDDAPGHAGGESQLIEAVVVHAAGPNGRERALDFALQRLELRSPWTPASRVPGPESRRGGRRGIPARRAARRSP